MSVINFADMQTRVPNSFDSSNVKVSQNNTRVVWILECYVAGTETRPRLRDSGDWSGRSGRPEPEWRREGHLSEDTRSYTMSYTLLYSAK